MWLNKYIFKGYCIKKENRYRTLNSPLFCWIKWKKLIFFPLWKKIREEKLIPLTLNYFLVEHTFVRIFHDLWVYLHMELIINHRRLINFLKSCFLWTPPPSRCLRSRLLSVRPLHRGLLGAAERQTVCSVFWPGIPSGSGALRPDVGGGGLLFQLLHLPHGPQVSSTHRPSCKSDQRDIICWFFFFFFHWRLTFSQKRFWCVCFIHWSLLQCTGTLNANEVAE